MKSPLTTSLRKQTPINKGDTICLLKNNKYLHMNKTSSKLNKDRSLVFFDFFQRIHFLVS